MRYRVITAELVARTAVHVGWGQGDDTTDAFCRRDAQGRWLIPGSAIGGVLRTLATRLAPRIGAKPCHAIEVDERTRGDTCDCPVCHLFGSLNPKDAEGGAPTHQARAARLLVSNAYSLGLTGAAIRDMVGIDRVTGTAARGAAAKFDLEVLPAGSRFTVRLELEDTTDQDEQLLAVALAEWVAGRAFIGGRIARGLGAFALCALEYRDRDLGQADQLMEFLRTDEPWTLGSATPRWLDRVLAVARTHVSAAQTLDQSIARSFVTIVFDLRAEGPLLVHDCLNAAWTGFDHAPLLSGLAPGGRPVLPGSTVRGVLRSHAERIARTLATLSAKSGDEFRRRCPACDPLASRPTTAGAATLESCDSLLRHALNVAGDVEVEPERLCLACRLFGSTRLGSRLIVEDAPIVAGTEVTYKLLDFLAIDRFTGGGREHAKFDALALWRPHFTARLHLENPAPWELGWLALAVRDLADQRLSLGFGGAKGFGRISVPRWTVTVGFIDTFFSKACG